MTYLSEGDLRGLQMCLIYLKSKGPQNVPRLLLENTKYSVDLMFPYIRATLSWPAFHQTIANV